MLSFFGALQNWSTSNPMQHWYRKNQQTIVSYRSYESLSDKSEVQAQPTIYFNFFFVLKKANISRRPTREIYVQFIWESFFSLGWSLFSPGQFRFELFPYILLILFFLSFVYKQCETRDFIFNLVLDLLMQMTHPLAAAAAAAAKADIWNCWPYLLYYRAIGHCEFSCVCEPPLVASNEIVS